MNNNEIEENLFAPRDAKLHGEMCKELSTICCKVLSIFPSLEAALPKSKSGIQALSSLDMALEKAKNILQHCSNSSKLYLAITGDSALLNFEKARSTFVDCLKRVADIVPQTNGCQVLEIIGELEATTFSLNPLEKQVGDEVTALLQQGGKFDNSDDNNEIECFHLAAMKLGITSSRAALSERRALKKLVARARAEEDKQKESIIAFLLHLMRKYSKLFGSELAEDNNSQGSTPGSPPIFYSLEAGVDSHSFDGQPTKLASFNFNLKSKKSGSMPTAPEELRCPLSLQLMYDPVIISSGQTYERICIEKWLSDGHNTCPKTQQKLSHFSLTPNYCVKCLIASWCEQNGVSVPDGPPESLDFNYWRLALSQFGSTNSRSVNSDGTTKLNGVEVVPLEQSGTIEDAETGCFSTKQEDTFQEVNSAFNIFQCYRNFMAILNQEEGLREKCKTVEHIRFLLKDNEEARIFMGSNGFVEALTQFLEFATHAGDVYAQEVGAMALFNLAVNNNRNKELMLAAGVITLLELMISNCNSHGFATALYLNLSCLEQAKRVIGSSKAVPFLIQILQRGTESRCKLDAFHTLFNLSMLSSNIPFLLSAGILSCLQSLLVVPGDHPWTGKAIAVLINLASSQSGKHEMVSTPGLISGLATILDAGDPIDQEQAACCLDILCHDSDKCCQIVLQEGVIPALVSISVNGTTRGKDKARKLLMLFREQRQRKQPSAESILQQAEGGSEAMPAPESRPPRRKVRKALSFLWKSKRYSVY